MSVHAYPGRVIAGDYFRAGTGLAFSAGFLAASPPPTGVGALSLMAVALFLIYGVRTILRHLSRIRLSDQGIAVTGRLVATSLPWPEVTGLRLRYYSTRRDRRNGWWQLNLDGNDARLRIASDLEGFEEVAARAVAAAGANGLNLDPATVENLSSLGIPAQISAEGRSE